MFQVIYTTFSSAFILCYHGPKNHLDQYLHFFNEEAVETE